MKNTNRYGPGTIAVAGNTLYFYTFTWVLGAATEYRLPRLSSLLFDEWQSGVSGAQLVSEELKAFNVLGYKSHYMWDSGASPLYPSGPGAVTLSVEDYEHDDWAIDAVVSNGARGALVHYLRAGCPSLDTASREVATFPRYSCRAFLNGTLLCAALGTGRYTWASEE